MGDAEELERLGAAHPAGLGPLAVSQVGRDRAVRKQPQVLEHVAGAAPLGRQVDVRRAVEQRLAADAGHARRAAGAARRCNSASVVLPMPEGPVIATSPASLAIVHSRLLSPAR